MLIYFTAKNGAKETVDTALHTPQALLGLPATSKQITYPTADGTANYTYTGPYYGTDPNDSDAGTNPNQTGHTTPVEGQLRATLSAAATKVGPTGSARFPLAGGDLPSIAWYNASGVLVTKFRMDNTTAVTDGLNNIGLALVAGNEAVDMTTAGAVTVVS